MAVSLLTVLQVSAPEDALADNLPDVKQPSTGERTACNKGVVCAGSLAVEPDPGTPQPREKCWWIVYICLKHTLSLLS